ncbi:E3 ubiquitin-protein ligase CHFR-like [Symsagittifera roscoffensis]|uniref:E3 ubiquitin-protein ligase CHFR-like n=1 Tax=Symsagittifera roscoffensis TaxID=84072 RepID=UPI00307B3D37
MPFASESELTCSICSEVFLAPVCLLPCLHCFCGGCISQWVVRRKTKCPLCRTKFNAVCKHDMLELDCESFLCRNPSSLRSSEESSFLTGSNMFNQYVHTVTPPSRQPPIQIYANNRNQALQYARVLVPLGFQPSDIHYRAVDHHGHTTRTRVEILKRVP